MFVPVVYRIEVWSIINVKIIVTLSQKNAAGALGGHMSGAKSGVLCHSSSVLLCASGALESKSHQQLDRCLAASVWVEQQDITVIVLCTIHFNPWLHENHTSAPEPWRHRLKPTRRNMFIRNQQGMSMSWNGIWLKYGQQPAELHWSIDRSLTRLFYCVSQSQKQTLWTFAMMCFSVICNSHDF